MMDLPCHPEHNEPADARPIMDGPILSTSFSKPIPISNPPAYMMPATSVPTSISSRRSSLSQVRGGRAPSSYFQDSWMDGNGSPHTYLSSSPLYREYISERTVPERSPSPHTRAPAPGALAEAMSTAKSPGLIRRLSRGAHNKLRRRASTTHSMRMRDQSAGPVLVRRRSDSVETSDPGQDVSDLDLDNPADDFVEDIPEVPTIPAMNRERHDAVGVSAGRPSNISISRSSTFEGGIAPASSAVLENGTWVTKITKRSKKRVKLWLDPNSARVCWHSKKASKSFFIDDVREYRIGEQSRGARDDVNIPPEQERLWVTIVYYPSDGGQRRTIKNMHVLMPDDFLLKLWTDALNTVTRQRIEVMNALSPSTEKHVKGMELAWKQIMTTRSGQMRENDFSLEDARILCRKLEINCTDHAVRTHFRSIVNDENAKMDEKQFRRFVQSFRERKEIQSLYANLHFGTDAGWALEDFMHFLTDCQRVDVTKDRSHWESVFEKFARPSQGKISQVDGESRPEKLTLSMQGLQNFLTSAYNGPLEPKVNDPTLERPLNEYIISSSHNTYLLGRQVRGTSSVEGYIAALVKGCRCIEIDCWDGDNGRPMVTHGRTMTNKIPFEDCVSVTSKYAFNSSPYPLIVSLEVHCNPEQQFVMVELMKKYFKDTLVTEPINPSSTSLPSPSELKHRILIKVKASNNDELEYPAVLADPFAGRSRSQSLNSSLARAPSSDCQSASASPLILSSAATSPTESLPSTTPRECSITSATLITPASSADDSDSIPAPAEKPRKRKTSRIIPELGKLGVYAQGIKFHGFQDPSAKAYNHIFSLAENVFEKLCVKKTDNKALLETHNVRHLMRVYPSNLRVDSSNFNPLMTWRRGVQMAALNWQNYDIHQQINEAMFAAGSDRSGYVLKPEELRTAKHSPNTDPNNPFAEKKEKKGRKLVRFTVDLISAQRLPRPRTQNADIPMNTYIELEVFSAEDRARSNSNGDSGNETSVRDGAISAKIPQRKRSRLIEGNGFDPQYNNTFTMAVETKFPSLIFLRWTVWNAPDGKISTSNPSLLATFTAKLNSLQQGYRHLPLFNPNGEQYRDAKLFVRIAKEAPVVLRRDEIPHSLPDVPPSPRSDAPRNGRSWTLKFLKRTPSQRKKERPLLESPGPLSRTSSIDNGSMRATADTESEISKP